MKSGSTDTDMSDGNDNEVDNLDGIKSAMEDIISTFRAPLDAKGVNLIVIAS